MGNAIWAIIWFTLLREVGIVALFWIIVGIFAGLSVLIDHAAPVTVGFVIAWIAAIFANLYSIAWIIVAIVHVSTGHYDLNFWSFN